MNDFFTEGFGPVIALVIILIVLALGIWGSGKVSERRCKSIGIIIAILIVGGIVAGVVMSCTPQEELTPEQLEAIRLEKLNTCKNVVSDAFHFPEEYKAGSSNYARIISQGVQPQNVGKLGPGHQDCKARYGQ